MKRFFALVLLAVTTTVVHAAEFSIGVRGIPRPVTMTFPDGFRLADSHSARERRERLLKFYSLNPAYKGRYDEILLRDWSSTQRVPSIVIGIPGSTVQHQGRISARNWNAIRREFASVSKKQIAEIRGQYRPSIESNSPVPVRTIDELIWFEEQTDPNSIVMLGHLRSELDGQLETVFSARKLLYYNGYMLFVNVVVDSSRPKALSTLKHYLNALGIVEI